MVRRTKEEAAATRELLLDTAERVFAERGVTRASLQDIASAAGLTRGAIYWHFKDKAELYIAMMERVCHPCESAGEEPACAAQRDVEQLLREELLGPLRLLRDDERARRVFTILIHRTEFQEELASVYARHREALAEFSSELAAVLRQGQALGRWRADAPPDTLARSLVALLNGLMARATLDDDPAAALADAEAALAVVLAGLRP